MLTAYILDYNGDAIPVQLNDDAGRLKWALWFEHDRGKWQMKDDIGDVNVSTVFLAIDHNFIDGGPPLLWETMVFGGTMDQQQWRYSTLAEARAGHANVVKMVKDAERSKVRKFWARVCAWRLW